MFTQRSVLYPAAAIIFVHFHPSGDPEPSHLEAHVCKLHHDEIGEHQSSTKAPRTQIDQDS